MGKYMRKGKGVGKMEVSQGFLGVRTRARALALQEKETASKFAFYHTTNTTSTSSIESSESSRALPLESQPHYMELRSRRFEKVARCEKVHETAQAFAGELPGQRKKISISRPAFPSVSPAELHAFGEDPSGIKIQNSSSSTQDISLLASAAAVAGSDAKSHTRHTPPAQSSLHSTVKGSSLCKPVAATASSTQSLGYSAVSIPQKRPLGILTRNQRHELACCLPNQNQEAMEVDTEMVSSEAAGVCSNNNEKEMEVEPYFGESPMITGPSSSKDRHYEPNTSRSTRECTPDSFIRDVEAPGSTSRTRHSSQVRSLSAPLFGRSNEAPPTSSEIEAFFTSAEQQERRRFVDRYNFDPLTERPLRGRYEWLNM